jgi:hypothetical protein
MAIRRSGVGSMATSRSISVVAGEVERLQVVVGPPPSSILSRREGEEPSSGEGSGNLVRLDGSWTTGVREKGGRPFEELTARFPTVRQHLSK